MNTEQDLHRLATSRAIGFIFCELMTDDEIDVLADCGFVPPYITLPPPCERFEDETDEGLETLLFELKDEIYSALIEVATITG